MRRETILQNTDTSLIGAPAGCGLAARIAHCHWAMPAYKFQVDIISDPAARDGRVVVSGKDEDSELFRDAMRDVKRLPARAPATSAPKPPAQARFTRADEREVLRESLLPPTDDAAIATGDELSFRRPHI